MKGDQSDPRNQHESFERTGVRMTLVREREWTGCSDGRNYRSEEWEIVGGEVNPAWRRDANGRERVAGWEPSSRFTLYVVDGEVDARLVSYGGVVWPTAWSDLFETTCAGTIYAGVEITDAGLCLRSAALYGASCADADARLLP